MPNIGSIGEINGAPCVAEYTVAAGETWIGLAKRFGTTAVILRRVNPGRLWAGDKIIVPAHSAAVVVVDPPPPPPPEPEPSRIMFAAGETAVTIGANVVANGQTDYIFRANEGQQHKITLAPSQDDVTFTLVNASNPSQNLPTEGILPATGDYIIRVSGGAVDATFSLALSIVDTENGGGLNLVDATRINFAPGATSAAVTGNVAAGQMVAYVFTASQGQKLVIEFTPSDAAVTYLVTPPQLGNVIPEDGILPLTGNYHLVITGGGVDATFSLMLSITNP
ncbi:MAG: LysM peptidoglycan-binding domain-containing protein [Chloroflexi bacterium]|nr:LysM peptidoglycan-binding domain-containing protein [Chloroflexota bacterium]